ncbi:MAG: sodium-independent anion transporter [gamma proteobacterium endosymbiont of Lamellibrachia anaximandri]|nr:sodium-independent anion transporter [gamma proteobacterium endosymbiont of Lamellibrachia anaximandri]MBL3535850.1 sodium-independent anion transporter [gamma proteobacterium endosymbiont of Lamellibrachia anaximandri]
MKIIRIDMSIYFGSLDYVQNRIHKIVEHENIKHILIVSTGINFIDLSASEMLVTEAKRLEKLGGGLYFAELKSSVYEVISKTCFIAKIGNNNFFDKKKDAIGHIYKKLDKSVCQKCTPRVFNECD